MNIFCSIIILIKNIIKMVLIIKDTYHITRLSMTTRGIIIYVNIQICIINKIVINNFSQSIIDIMRELMKE